MKKLSWPILVVFSVITMQAQDSLKIWSLENCINHAINNNISIKQLQLGKEDAAIQLNTSKASRLPDLNAGVGQNWNFGRGQTSTGIYESQTLSNSNINISSSIPLFTGFRINNEIKKSELDLKAATHSLEKSKEDLALNVASLYLQVLFNKEILKVSEEQLSLSKIQVEKTKSLVEAGSVPKSQLYDIEAQVAKDEVTLIQSKNTLNLSLLDLAQSLELERTSNFDIVVPEIQDAIAEYMNSLQHPDAIYNNAIASKPVIKEKETKLESAKKSMKIAESGFYPKLNLGLSYSNNYFYNYSIEGTPNPLSPGEFLHNKSFSEQFKDNAGESIGLSLSIPIFNRFQVRNQVNSAKLNIINQQFELENTKKTLYKEIQTAYLNATAAQEKYRSTGKAVEASQESFKYAQERYGVGKSSVFEFNEAKTKLVQSLSEQIQAKYDFIFRSKILDFYNGLPIKL